MNRHEKDNLNFNLNRRALLLDELGAQITAAGQTFRRIEHLDKKLTESLKDIIAFPEGFTAAGLRKLFDMEIAFQISEGDPLPGSFIATIAAPRDSFFDLQLKTHAELLAGNFNTEKGA